MLFGKVHPFCLLLLVAVPKCESQGLRLGPGPCASAPCLNAGRCIVTSYVTSQFTCECLPGYTGSRCELGIDECVDNPCVHGACVDNIGSFRCHCFPGFTGNFCDVDIDECASSPCFNDGTCNEAGPGLFQCTCRRGFRGRRCQMDINECLALSPCQNGGRCQQAGPGNYVCVCPEGYTGTNCEFSVDTCASNPCQNGGRCEDIPGSGFLCDCLTGYSDPTCSTQDDPCSSLQCLSPTVCESAIDGDGHMCVCPPQSVDPLCTDAPLNLTETYDNSLSIYARPISAASIAVILGVLGILGLIMAILGALIMACRRSRPQDLCFSLPPAFYRTMSDRHSSKSGSFDHFYLDTSFNSDSFRQGSQNSRRY